jgi:hypothetical protein
MNSSASEAQESAMEGVLCEAPLSFFLLKSLLIPAFLRLLGPPRRCIQSGNEELVSAPTLGYL